jgi:hypothetical protein
MLCVSFTQAVCSLSHTLCRQCRRCLERRLNPGLEARDAVCVFHPSRLLTLTHLVPPVPSLPRTPPPPPPRPVTTGPAHRHPCQHQTMEERGVSDSW